MRAYRFVDFLGRECDAAGQRVAESAAVEFHHQGGLKDSSDGSPNQRVGFELLRQIARQLDGAERNRIQIEAKAFAPIDDPDPAWVAAGGTLGIHYEVVLPEFEQRNTIIALTYHEPQLETLEHEDALHSIEEELQERLESTPSIFLFSIGDNRVRVFPGQAVTAIQGLTERPTITESLYSKTLSRFIEEFVEGFHGDPTLVPDIDPSNPTAAREWARTIGLDGVLFIRLATAPTREAASLRDFV
jgi:hypothetical protein